MYLALVPILILEINIELKTIINKNNNNNNIEIIKPFIFTKKISDKHKIIPLNINKNTLGPTRYFPPATKEWYNSIYTYNNNYTKNLPVADKNLSIILRSYFNYYLNKKALGTDFIRKPMRLRRLSLNKIFLSKAELKHTNEKVVITLYVYNEEKRLLNNKLNRIEKLLFPKKGLSGWKEKRLPFSFIKKVSFLSKLNKRMPMLVFLTKMRDKLIFENSVLENNLRDLKASKLRANKLKLFLSLNKKIKLIDNTITLIQQKGEINIKLEKSYREYLIKRFLEKELKITNKYLALLKVNQNKFSSMLPFLKEKLHPLYTKNIEFNIINLKTLYLNSDIFTQAIAIKLKNRDNRLLRVLRRSINMVKLPHVNIVREKQQGYINIKELLENKVRNININNISNKYSKYNDVINQILLEVYPDTLDNKKTEKETINSPLNTLKDDNTIENIVLSSLKYKRMGGVRLEAKGRLTRRFTASRSVFKVKWKGSLKNIDSSYRGLSSVMLRGHVKSNVQYSIINSKTRNGAFGLKGWISSK